MWGKTKPKEREYSGFMGDTSPEQEDVLQKFKEWVQTAKLDPKSQFDDYDMLRFCRARKFVLENVKTMFGNFIDWRRKNDVDSVLEDF